MRGWSTPRFPRSSRNYRMSTSVPAPRTLSAVRNAASEMAGLASENEITVGVTLMPGEVIADCIACALPGTAPGAIPATPSGAAAGGAATAPVDGALDVAPG